MGRGFQVTAGEWRLGQFTTLEGQLIANGPDGGSLLDEDTRNRFSSNNESLPNFWIAAPKTTDSLFIAPSEAHPGLQIHRVGAPALSDDNTGDVVTAVRAAALSATTLIVNRAAIHLDIDPEEFDIIEPRVLTMNGQDVPLLQITDHLVNGVGFCDRLGRPFAGAEQPLIEELIRSMVTDEESYPLEDCMAHRNECDQACYQCLHRYSNQMYHGLLDWRLGLCYLKCLIDQNFDCGLESSRFDEAFQSDWRELAMRLARMFVTRFGGNPTVDLRQDLRLPAFRIPSTRDRWCVVCHPLWIPNPDSGLIAETIGRLGVPADQVSLTDSFELGRRQVTEYQRLRPEGT
ncbi:MAG: hypothetical protein O3A00_03715 [Planctomycetota bacterium]|nr:hypothetical protein [Planctomycetota bacterium]